MTTITMIIAGIATILCMVVLLVVEKKCQSQRKQKKINPL